MHNAIQCFYSFHLKQPNRCNYSNVIVYCMPQFECMHYDLSALVFGANVAAAMMKRTENKNKIMKDSINLCSYAILIAISMNIFISSCDADVYSPHGFSCEMNDTLRRKSAFVCFN